MSDPLAVAKHNCLSLQGCRYGNDRNTYTPPSEQRALAFNCICDQCAQGQTISKSTDDVTAQDGYADMKTIFVITPTHTRQTQKIDLTSMCHTLMHIPKLTWIIIEDGSESTKLVTNFIQRCKVEIVHLLTKTSSKYIPKKGQHRWSKPRGVEQRNAGLSWLRQHYSPENCNGVVYFGDDDNKYDLRLFDEVSNTHAHTHTHTHTCTHTHMHTRTHTCTHTRSTHTHTHTLDSDTPLDSQNQGGLCMEGSVVGWYAVEGSYLQKWECRFVASWIL